MKNNLVAREYSFWVFKYPVAKFDLLLRAVIASIKPYLEYNLKIALANFP